MGHLQQLYYHAPLLVTVNRWEAHSGTVARDTLAVRLWLLLAERVGAFVSKYVRPAGAPKKCPARAGHLFADLADRSLRAC